METEVKKVDEKKLNQSIELFFMSKSILGYLFIVSLILAFEVIMLVRAFFVFNFTYWRHVSYFASYIVLILATIPVLAILIESYRRKKMLPCAALASNIYVVVIIVWACLVSFLDMVGGHTFIVYLTVIMGVGAMTVTNPKLYNFVVIPLSLVLLLLAYVFESDLVRTTGYLFNYAVFVCMASLITTRQFRNTKREYLDRIKLEDMSFHDMLTGLKNRNAMAEELKDIKKPFMFGVVDIDDFKALNDNYGHSYGDNCLKIVGKSLKNFFGDYIFRFGGDELLIISFTDKDRTIQQFDKVNDILFVRFQTRDVSLSGGFTYVDPTKESFDEYFKRADKALYKAKTNGKKQAIVE